MLYMRFDLRLSPHSPAKREDLYAAALDMASWADNIPGARISFPQHHSSPDGYMPSPMIMAAAAAARTQKLPIALTNLLLMYDPIKLAEDMSILDNLSKGRVNYIIGLGYRQTEYDMFGIDSRKRGQLLEEYLDVLNKAFTGEAFNWRGRDAQLRPLPFTPGGPVRAYGGGTVAAAKRAARYGMTFISQSKKPELRVAYDEEATRCGKPTGQFQSTPSGFPMSIYVAEDVDQAWREVGPYILHDALAYAEWLGEDRFDISTWSGAKSIDALRAESGAYQIVTPARARELLGQFGMLMAQPLIGGLPPELAWRSLKLIESQVLS